MKTQQMAWAFFLVAFFLLNSRSQSLAVVNSNTMAEFSSVPINLTSNDVTPLAMLNVSRDHQLSYKAYNDYSDINGDGAIETSYSDSIEYYGYFDSGKCYTYNTSSNRFVPAAAATGVNGHYCSGQWSGNFLNWASMTRMDVVRKLLYGGMRSTDTSTLTVLERHYLPTDAHAFAKYYNGSDISSLTPFATTVTTPPAASGTASGGNRAIPTSGSVTRTYTTSLSVSLGDQIKAFVPGSESSKWIIGGVSSTGSGTITITVPEDSYAGGGSTNYTNWTLQNLSQTGISFCNLTEGSTSGSNRYSDTNTNAPSLRVAKGNFALWNANERWQCYWSGEKSNLQSGFSGGFRSNGNRAYLSGINASAENPSQTTHGMGSGAATGEYNVRVEVCNSSALGQERCKQYGSSYKPIGLLQMYGDGGQINFGLLTGSFAKNISGGVLRKNISSFASEVSSTNGTFISTAYGIVHNMNKLRLYGYGYNDGTYIGHDSCNFQQTGLVLSGGSTSQGSPANQGNCSSWGNPMSEMHLESLRQFAGRSPTSAFTYGAGSKDATLGLTVATWVDPISSTNYCAQLNVLNFNASISSYDGDQMSGVSDLGAGSTAQSLTNDVGVYEGIDTSSWFIGSNGVSSNDLCTSKAIGSGFGSFSGLCPEAPTQQGTYLQSGVAHYAKTNRIRSDITIPAARANSGDLTVSTYGIALATNVPKIEVVVNGNTVTILPAYRLDVSSTGAGPFGGGTLVDFKIIEKTATHGKFYANWEDSEMGGDYDQDMWGILEYSVSGGNITITTDAVSQSTGNGQGFGYVISGTNHDGAHFHSGILNFDYTDPTGVQGCSNCNIGDLPTSVTYSVSGSSAGVLEDPLWYSAKWGGFIDADNSKRPDQVAEWDKVNNTTGAAGADGLPDNFFYATNPLQLENALNRVFLSILQRASSGTAAAVVSNNVSGTGALYQAYYEPRKFDLSGNEVSWIGTLQALWMDSYGYIRENDDDNTDADGDGIPDGVVLENYNTDRVVEFYYDETQNRTRIKRYSSTSDDVFTPYYMQGVVTGYSAGVMTITVDEISGAAGSGPFNDWVVTNNSNDRTGTSSSSLSIVDVATTPPANTVTLTVSPTSDWVSLGDTVQVAHYAYSVIELVDVGTLWNARKNLSFSGADPTVQRTYAFQADGYPSGGRFIKTWIDSNYNSKVDLGEFVDLTSANITSANYGNFNVATLAEAQNVVNYVRGQEVSGYRRRTIDYNGDGLTEVIRLGDIVNSTPTVVGSTMENFDLIYKDTTYTAFKKQYAKRRQVIYVGANDGMLHAFNGGFYDSATKSFLVAGNKHDGTPAIKHPLGAEIWAYVPLNLLPHLKWLKDNYYPHVYYVDGKPKVFDAKIFPADADHPNGWGTVLVVGMRFGGGPMTVDTAADGLSADITPVDNRVFASAYVILDITNPEAEPNLLAEIQMPNQSYTTSYPAVFSVKDILGVDANKWFLVFGSGPNTLGQAASSTTPRVYAIDLVEVVAGSSATYIGALPNGCTQVTLGTGPLMALACDPSVNDASITAGFVGDMMTVDWDLDFKGDSVYFGLVGDKNATSGRVMRWEINGEASPTDWDYPRTLVNVAQPVVAAVTPGLDDNGNKWIFFGTGRLFASDDQSSTATQSIYGVEETGTEVLKADLLNVSNADVETDGTLTGVVPSSIDTFTKLKDAVAGTYDAVTNPYVYAGWYCDLPLIQGITGTDPATRVVTQSALAGGILFTSAYQPSLDPCLGDGLSRLYALYYLTGTAYPTRITLGIDTDAITGKEYAEAFVELGHGFAASPSIHSGGDAGDGDGTIVSVFTQLSTGTVIRTEARTATSVRSGLQSWIEADSQGQPK